MDAPQLAQTELDTDAWPDGVFALLHDLWGDAKTGTPYDRRQKAKWHRLAQSLREHQLTHDQQQAALVSIGALSNKALRK